MAQSGSAQLCRQRLSELIQLAVPEPDDQRRRALLVMADHWSELLRLRTRSEAVTPRHPGARTPHDQSVKPVAGP